MANDTDVDDIPGAVRERIARFSGVPIVALTDDLKLTDELAMKHPSLVQLAESLRKLVTSRNPNGTVDVADVETDEATVASTVTLVQDRIGQA